MPTPQASSLSSVLHIKKKKKLADYFSWIFCSVAFLPDFFTFSVLKERKEHESVKIVSKKAEAREGASSPGKAKRSQKDTIAVFGGEQHGKTKPTGGGKFRMYGSQRQGGQDIPRPSLVFVKVFELEIVW